MFPKGVPQGWSIVVRNHTGDQNVGPPKIVSEMESNKEGTQCCSDEGGPETGGHLLSVSRCGPTRGSKMVDPKKGFSNVGNKKGVLKCGPYGGLQEWCPPSGIK
jgi:hypothetical protein